MTLRFAFLLKDRIIALHSADVILIDDFYVLTGSSDVDADPDYSLAKVFAILKSVVTFIEGRKTEEALSKTRTRSDGDFPSQSVIMTAFSSPLQSRGSSVMGVCKTFFDSIFEICRLDSSHVGNGVLHDVADTFSLTPVHHRESGYRFLFALSKSNLIKLESIQIDNGSGSMGRH